MQAPGVLRTGSSTRRSSLPYGRGARRSPKMVERKVAVFMVDQVDLHEFD